MKLSRSFGAGGLTAWNRLILVNVLCGIVLGFVVVAAIIVVDLHGLGSLLRRSDQGLVAGLLLTAGFATLAAAGLLSTAIAAMPARAPVHRR